MNDKRKQLESDQTRGLAEDVSGRELIDMAQAIAMLKTTRNTFYRWLRAGKVTGMKVGRQWRFYKDDIERFLKGQAPRIDLPADITPLLDQLRISANDAGVSLPERERTPVEEAIHQIIAIAVARRASDIHITTHMPLGKTVSTTLCRIRIDGVLHTIAEIDRRLLPAIVAQWKRMAACDVHETTLFQDGRITLSTDFIKQAGSGQLDLRVCFLPTALGESVTVRILDASAVVLDLDRIDLEPDDRERLNEAIDSPWGLAVICGPTGSGKTTMLYACLNRVAGPEVKVLAAEHPVEFFLPWTVQVSINPDAGITFPRAIRSMLRSDPDVMLIGEIRDVETLRLCQQASLTGHLVMTTLHTDSAASALKRMIDIGGNPFVVADSTRFVMAQKLARCLCKHCAEAYTPDASTLDRVARAARDGGLDWDSVQPSFKRPVGCTKCAQTGYRGRKPIVETIKMTRELGHALREGATLDELQLLAVSQGMTSIVADGIRKAARGETSLEEVMRLTGLQA